MGTFVRNGVLLWVIYTACKLRVSYALNMERKIEKKKKNKKFIKIVFAVVKGNALAETVEVTD